MRHLFSVFLVVLMLAFAGCATVGGPWQFKSQDSEYTIQIPAEVPDFTEWTGPIKPIHLSKTFRLYAMIANNPKPDKTDRVILLWSSEGPVEESRVDLIGLCYVKDSREVNGEKIFYIDKAYWDGGPPSGNLEPVEQPKYLEELVEIRTKATAPKQMKWEV
jgi:hypothetical protein